ncbi:TetR/AcrR family transcriptional regulator [Tsukamurella soli]|uniref:TetR family transcriptional regulator n=1 Tax=Tsukamurella soli TaxID=644556 RepID=A0ABP8K6Z6_9ACTN
MSTEPGRRETRKRATRQALQDAADRLFAARGYDRTTVREIAEEAGTTERTFFRYFSGKEDLLTQDIERWLPVFGETIRCRPAAEPPLTAIQNAIAQMAREHGATMRPNLAWMFLDGPPAVRMGRAGRGLLLKIEDTIATALGDRSSDPGPAGAADFASQIAARCAVAVLRSAAIRDWQLRTDGVTARPQITDLLTEAFGVARRLDARPS